MSRTLWRKVWRDLSHNKGRSLLVMAAITVGVIATGSILMSFSVTNREIDRSLADTNPPSAIFHIDSVDDKLVAAVEARPDVVAAEARREVTTRLVRDPDEWVDLLLVVDDFDDITVGEFFPDTGQWSPDPNEILIERSSLDEVKMDVGDVLSIELPGTVGADLTVAGLAHDPGRTPAWTTGVLVGYVTPNGLQTLGGDPVLDELWLEFTNPGDRASNWLTADTLAADLTAAGIDVGGVEVPVPGEHPAANVMETMGFLLQAFGVLALLTSGALVATLVVAELKKQTRQIALMKTIGARTSQIASIYLAAVLALSAAALLIGLPLAIVGSPRSPSTCSTSRSRVTPSTHGSFRS
ncbi:MAG: hypothetical protein GY708_09190 [Actinomycetia bacterium]|nr:hypothetical protein [Actinomycetes bacterium]